MFIKCIKTILLCSVTLSFGVFAAPVATNGTITLIDWAGNPYETDPLTGFVDQESGTWGMTASEALGFMTWEAYDGTLLTEGSYSIDTGAEVIDFTVGSNQIAGHIFVNWGGLAPDIDLLNIWDINADGSLTSVSAYQLLDSPYPNFSQSVDLTSPGLISAVPVPAAAWLFSTGLISLMSVARRKRV